MRAIDTSGEMALKPLNAFMSEASALKLERQRYRHYIDRLGGLQPLQQQLRQKIVAGRGNYLLSEEQVKALHQLGIPFPKTTACCVQTPFPILEVRMMLIIRRSLLCILCSLLMSCSATAQEPAPIPGAQIVLPIFQPILEQLQRQTRIPVVLPTDIPTEAVVPESTGKPQAYIAVPITQDGKFQHVYVHIIDAQPDRYEISLDATSTCQGQDSCSFGLLSAQQLHQGDQSVQAEYAFEQAPDFQPTGRSPEPIGEVALARGIPGYFVPFVCGANCDTAKVIWEQNGYRYKVGIRYAEKATVVHLANSVIQNEQ